MRLIFYIFFIVQFLNALGVFAEKANQDSSRSNYVKWEKVKENHSYQLKKIIWKSYKNDEIDFENKNQNGSIKGNTNSSSKKRKKNTSQKSFFSIKKIEPLNAGDTLISSGGITVSNALIPRAGTTQIKFNYDEKGNMFGFYGYSFSNAFQLELLNIGIFDEGSFSGDKYSNLHSTYFNEHNLNYRLGGKVLISSPQKKDFYWIALRSSIGKNNENNQGYIFSELITTFKLNKWLSLNIAPKYFFSGVESFGGVGFSSYINILDNLLLIPEINNSINNNSDFNSTIALRYSFSSKKSLDLYYSNAGGVQDIGQFLQDKEYKLGINLNFLL